MSAEPPDADQPATGVGRRGTAPDGPAVPDEPQPAQEAEPTGAAGLDLARAALAGVQRGSARRAAATRAAQRGRRRKSNRNANLASGRAGYSGAGADQRDPQVASDVLSGLMSQMGWQRPLTEARIFADWARLVGDDLAAHCRPDSLRDGELRITAESTAWATQIRRLTRSLVHRLNGELGSTVVVRLRVTGPVGPSWRHGPRAVPGARGPRDTYG